MKSKLWIVVLAIALGAAMLMGDPAQAIQLLDGKKVMVFGGRQPAPNIDPSLKTDWSKRMLQQAFYDGLYKYEGNPAKLMPWLAESHEVNAEATKWTFHLVKNAVFHNGDPVTAATIKWSIERTLKLNKGPSWMLSDLLTVDDIKVVDDYTLEFNLNKSYAPLMSVLPWFYVMNPKVVMKNEKDGDYGQEWLKDNEAGSGPFKKGRWEHGVLYEMVAVVDYWRGWPHENHPDSIIFKLIRETNSMKIGLQKGELDMVAGLSPDDLDLIEKMPGIEVSNDPGITTFGLKMNTKHGLTKDINIRKALSYAFDYEATLKVFNGKAILQDSPLPIGLRGHQSANPYHHDLAKAKEYMAKAGYPEGGFELEYVYVQGLDSEKTIGLILIDNMAKIGIKIKMVPLTWPNMVARGSKVETSPALIAIFTTPKYDDPDAVAYQYHKNSWGKYYGSSFYENAEVWEMIEKARSISDWDERMKYYTKIQPAIMADAPEIFGMQMNRQWAFRDYVKGFTFCPLRFTNEVDVYPLYIEQ